MGRWHTEKRYGLVDLKTGEVFEGIIKPWLPKMGGKWVKKFQDTAKELGKQNNLHGQSYRVLYYLDTVVRWGNVIPAPPKIAEDLSLSEVAVYRAYAELIKAEIVIKREKVYYLSPLYCWKGTYKDYEIACKELLTGSIKLLSEEGK